MSRSRRIQDSDMSARTPISLIAALVVTGALFFGMWGLIATTEMVLDEYSKRPNIDFVRVRQDTQAKSKKRELPKKQRPDPPPKTPDMDMPDNAGPGATGVMAMTANIDSGMNLGEGFKLGAAPADSDAVPVVRIEPMYPRRAAEQFIEGWVQVAFDITTRGTTKNVRVQKASPKAIFDRAAVQAVKKWKYNPKIVDGKPVERRGLNVRLNFKLDG